MLEVFIQSILYLREVYPAGIFRKRKYYSTAVYISIYPELTDYLKQVLTSIKYLKEKNQLRRVELVIYRPKIEDSTDYLQMFGDQLMNSCSPIFPSPPENDTGTEKIIEKFVFELDRPPTTNGVKNGEKPSMLDEKWSKDKYLIKFEEELRKALIQLEQMSRNLSDVERNEERTFKINVETTESAFTELTAESKLQVGYFDPEYKKKMNKIDCCCWLACHWEMFMLYKRSCL